MIRYNHCTRLDYKLLHHICVLLPGKGTRAAIDGPKKTEQVCGWMVRCVDKFCQYPCPLLSLDHYSGVTHLPGDMIFSITPEFRLTKSKKNERVTNAAAIGGASKHCLISSPFSCIDHIKEKQVDVMNQYESNQPTRQIAYIYFT